MSDTEKPQDLNQDADPQAAETDNPQGGEPSRTPAGPGQEAGQTPDRENQAHAPEPSRPAPPIAAEASQVPEVNPPQDSRPAGSDEAGPDAADDADAPVAEAPPDSPATAIPDQNRAAEPQQAEEQQQPPQSEEQRPSEPQEPAREMAEPEQESPDAPEPEQESPDAPGPEQESPDAPEPEQEACSDAGPGDAPSEKPEAEKAAPPEKEKPEVERPEFYRLVGVKFRRAGKNYFFNAGALRFSIGERVIVETERGLGLARVVTPVFEKKSRDVPKDVKRVIRKANWNDLERGRKNQEREQEAFDFCVQRINSKNLDMKMVKVEYFHDASKAIFYFTAEQRVDFRDLVKELARHLHTRIEMRQIGVRDEAKIAGGLGPCGQTVCCNTFLADFSPVSVRMAKDQNLAMNPTKVSGLCGRLMCCLAYEHPLYREHCKGMPKKGKRMVCQVGECRVVDLNILTRKALVELESGKTMFVPVEELKTLAQAEQEMADACSEFEDTEEINNEVLDSDDPRMLEQIEQRKHPAPGANQRPPNGRPQGQQREEAGKERPHEGKRHGRGRRRVKKERAATDRPRAEGNRPEQPPKQPPKQPPPKTRPYNASGPPREANPQNRTEENMSRSKRRRRHKKKKSPQ